MQLIENALFIYLPFRTNTTVPYVRAVIVTIAAVAVFLFSDSERIAVAVMQMTETIVTIHNQWFSGNLYLHQAAKYKAHWLFTGAALLRTSKGC